jgi:dethiobiotin synthetase
LKDAGKVATNKPVEGDRRRGRLLIITGTGTSIGKTHVAEALILAWRRQTARVVGLKPVESGVQDGSETDEARLGAVSSFHVKHAPYRLTAPLSPHLAAREEGIAIDLETICAFVDSGRQQADATVVELPGGLFTPLTEKASNADLVSVLAPSVVLLVAPDRLGVLHDVAACMRAAATKSVRIDGVVLVAPGLSDASTGRNAQELSSIAGVPVWAVIPRGSPHELSELPVLSRLVDEVTRLGQ